MTVLWRRFIGTARMPGSHSWEVHVEFEDGAFHSFLPAAAHVTGHCEAISADGKLVIHLFNATGGAYPALYWLTVGADGRAEGIGLANGTALQNIAGDLIP